MHALYMYIYTCLYLTYSKGCRRILVYPGGACLLCKTVDSAQNNVCQVLSTVWYVYPLYTDFHIWKSLNFLTNSVYTHVHAINDSVYIQVIIAQYRVQHRQAPS